MRSTTIRNNTFDLWWTWISILFIIPATRLIKCNGLALSPDLRKRIELKTTAKNPFASQVALQDFLVRPVHWPLIVASSDSVKPVLSPQANRNSDWVETLSRGRRVAPSSAIDVSTPLEVGQSVEEVFGLGLLKVRWTCKYSTLDRLLVVSPEGVSGIATNCCMDFDFVDDATVNFTMSFCPSSPLAYFAIPVLVIDNWLALNVLLPQAADLAPLNTFRRLMGTLYGAAGLAHVIDLLIGDSQLFQKLGIPPFQNLPWEGKALALLWCAAGPLAFALSRLGTGCNREKVPELLGKNLLADGGLILYGLVEVLGAVRSGNSDACANALGIQVIVAASWYYTWQKQEARQSTITLM